jgi:hypothetical protein
LQVPEKRKGDRTLHRHEQFILRVLYHLVAVAAYNGQPLRTIFSTANDNSSTEAGCWERLGLCLNTSLALLNHNCDPNVLAIPSQDRRCVLLVASRHIQPREELVLAYVPTYLDMELAQRDYQLVKHYNLECECQACRERWPLRALLADSLARIPNFEQEKCYVVHHGDKKDICDEINGARWMADFGITSGSFEMAQEALDALSRSLERHVRKPHLYFVEAAVMVERLAISQYVGISLDDPDDEAEIEAVQTAAKEQAAAPSRTMLTTTNGHHEAVNTNNTEKSRGSDKRSEVVNGSASPKRDPTPEGLLKHIKLFESSKDPAGAVTSEVVMRAHSPSLRQGGNGGPDKVQNRKSVLERFEESRLNLFGEKQVKELKQEMAKAKRELADSMRLFPAKAVMAERLAAFQNKALKVCRTGLKWRELKLAHNYTVILKIGRCWYMSLAK